MTNSTVLSQPLLLLLTIVTGIVDAVSYLALNHVFVANMTGNVVFLGFAVAGSQEFSIAASLVAIGAFLLGALAVGRFGMLQEHRGRFLAIVVLIEIVLIGLATRCFADRNFCGWPELCARIAPCAGHGASERCSQASRRSGPHDNGAHLDADGSGSRLQPRGREEFQPAAASRSHCSDVRRSRTWSGSRAARRHRRSACGRMHASCSHGNRGDAAVVDGGSLDRRNQSIRASAPIAL